MFRVSQRVYDETLNHGRRYPERVVEGVRLDLNRELLTKVAEVGLSVEDFLIRYTSVRNVDYYRGWYTEYMLIAAPLAEARDLLGVRA